MKPFYRAAGISCDGDTSPLRLRFWSECLQVVQTCSADMLSVNRRPDMFAGLLNELISYSAAKPPPPPSRRHTPLTGNCRADWLSSVRHHAPLRHRHTGVTDTPYT